MSGERPIRGWQLAGLLVLLVVAAFSMPLGARPADGVSSVLPALRPMTLVAAPGGGAHADVASLAAGATPGDQAPATRGPVVACAAWVLATLVAVATVAVARDRPGSPPTLGRLRSRAPPVTS